MVQRDSVHVVNVLLAVDLQFVISYGQTAVKSFRASDDQPVGVPRVRDFEILVTYFTEKKFVPWFREGYTFFREGYTTKSITAVLSIDRIIVDILDSHNCVKKEKSRNNSLGPISKSSDSFDNESISPKDFVKVLKIEIFS